MSKCILQQIVLKKSHPSAYHFSNTGIQSILRTCNDTSEPSTFFSLTRLVTRLRTEKQVGNINIPFKILPAEKATFGLLEHLAFARKKSKYAVQEKDTDNWLTLARPYIICRFNHSGPYQITCMMSLLSSK